MSEIEELKARVAALEERLTVTEGLRASMDNDLGSVSAKVTANNHLVQAVAITQSEHTKQLNQITETLAKHSTGLDGIASLLQILIEREGGSAGDAQE